ncbi:MAG: adenosylmethionine--8-amino-7-oxononanoate transaminase [Nitrospinaceae bacterium]|nr:adenosylmethionine--8-amino-7-oxononanoate transaminase [Nitrospinaceae bacterium]NIR56993.1 adenosylmethionine--8-amino-7-oxononanoate transaminase [Nitrospinaceae bacterium]NIS87450.1 adenosylmethionine--8-amino-7-oxononanoate transaminase [Nitrospinaceae bacterium]NIT84299.1 adenosylmethionine--8-amino-7-oxononanoate transaminase [Nitrospinaceae bacterium]NIU46489.1 adenosylmethionine--8-amino-7-oxononanoate transaminase [Nitrospinaceae bacterium]
MKHKIDEDLVRDFHHVWHPCTQMKDHESVPPLLIDRADGIYLYDREGRRYMDVISSWWVNLFGHNHPRINQAIRDQLDRMAHVMFAGVTHQPAIDLAEKLVRLSSPELTRVFFSDNGSTSVEVALKMSLQYWLQVGKPQKTQFIYLTGGYHGETLGALSVCGMNLFREQFDPVLAKHIEVPGPDCMRCPYGLKRDTCQAECFEPLEKALEQNRGAVAGMILEPLVQGAAGMKMYPPVYLQKLEDACRTSQVHVIYDEVAVGFGRTGSLFVSEHHGLNPDFVCLSKGITSGYLPLAATLTTEEIYQAFYDEYETFKWFIHSHSYSANPLACAAANTSLSLLTEEGFIENLVPKIQAIGEQGASLRDMPWCGEFRQTGMIAAVELVQDRETLQPFPAEQRIGYQIFLEGLKHEVYLRPLGNVVYFIPPLIIEPEQIKVMMTTAHQCIHTVLEKK